MNNAPRNLRQPTTVPLATSMVPSHVALASTPSGERQDKPTGNKKGVKKLKKILGNKKAISTILAALLMVVIVVVASVMVYAWSTGLLGSLLVTPTAGKEALNADTSSFYNATMATVNIRNTGSASVSLVTYYVKDTAGDTYSNTAWAGPTGIAPNAVNPTNFDINTAGNHCGGCALSGGSAFTFTTGNSYTITVVTSRNNQFVFTVVR
jgi:FlaG/FlaF family flagellin (archaellin)